MVVVMPCGNLNEDLPETEECNTKVGGDTWSESIERETVCVKYLN